MLKKILAALVAVSISGASAFAGSVTPLSGPQDPSQLNAVINTLIVSGNTSWNPAGASFLAANNISANASTTISYSTSTGASGISPVTNVEWLKIRNPSGAIRMIPMWGCPTC